MRITRPASPRRAFGTCELDERGVCRDCRRTIDEIARTRGLMEP